MKAIKYGHGRHSGARPGAGERFGITRRARWTSAGLLAATLCLLGASTPQGQGVDATRGLLERWVETKRLVSKEEQEWRLGREILEDRILLLEREIGAIRERIGQAQESIDAAQGRRDELESERSRLVEVTDVLAQRAGELERDTVALERRLPDPLRERLRPLTQRLGRVDGETRVSLGERFQNIAGILNESNRFQREVLLGTEFRERPGRGPVEVSVLYFGLGQAFFVTADGSFAGVGRPGMDGWVFEERNDRAADITALMEMARNRRTAAFVRLPVVLAGGEVTQAGEVR